MVIILTQCDCDCCEYHGGSTMPTPGFRTFKNEANASEVRKRKMKHFGHIIRHNSLEKTIIQGITAGKRGRGRPARTWEKDIEEWARTNIGESTRMAERRDLW